KREIIRSRKTVFDRLAFFFSSRRRHTRFSRDWSSDVCSSDLDTVPPENRTLGWPILEWVTEYVLQPDGPQAGEPFTFTDEQVRILLRWFALDEGGRFRYRSGTIRRLKGWGKDPFLAVLSLVEFVGPSRFGGWNAAGMPVAVPHPAPWVQVAAVSLTQTRNTFRLFPGMMSPELIDEYGVDPGKEITYSR